MESLENVEKPPAEKHEEDNAKEASERDQQHSLDEFDEMDEQHHAFDSAIPDRPDDSTRDSSEMYDPSSSDDGGGRAGLDPNHSAQWVPYSINPSLNLSKSKKRRRRQKRKQEALKNMDSLGKLLSGKQSKQDQKYISTYDLGNQQAGSSRQPNLNESGVWGGNMDKPSRPIENCADDRSFAATMNSTKFGEDFDTNDLSQLREGSDVAESMVEEMETLEKQGAPKDDDNSKPSPVKDQEQEQLDDSHSSNSTGARKTRRRTKKNPTRKEKKLYDPTLTGD